MKSIYQRIGLILVIGLIIQIVLIGVFYQQLIVKKIITEINSQEERRQYVLQEAIQSVQKYGKNIDKLKKNLNQVSDKYDTNFIIKDSSGKVIAESLLEDNKERIENIDYIKTNGKITYTIIGYYPSNISDEIIQRKDREDRIITIAILIIVAVITLLCIYFNLTKPLKNLSKAINNLNYGNTTFKIPYKGEDELGLLCRNLENMGIRLKESEESQQELIQAVSHDIKTPLTSILGYSKRLLEGKVKYEREQEYYETIYRKALDLKTLLEELEDYTVNNRQVQLERKPVEIKNFLEGLIHYLNLEIIERGGRINYSIEISSACTASIDTKKIQRVFQNLFSNSIKYAGESCLINIKCMEMENDIYIEFMDDGIGVPEALLGKIFEKFYRVETSRSREKGGTGLGLSICKDIIENHEGQIGAKCNVDCGLTIWFNIPKIKKEA